MKTTLTEIRAFRVPAGSLAVWWLGQAGFLIKSPGGALAALDPYLSDSCGPATQAMGFNFFRGYPPPLPPAELAGVDLFPDGQMPPQTLRMNLVLQGIQDRYRELTVGEPWVYGRRE